MSLFVHALLAMALAADTPEEKNTDEDLPVHVKARVWSPHGAEVSSSLRAIRESVIARHTDFEACWTVPLRPAEVSFQLRPDGAIQKSKLESTTGEPSIDACVLEHLDQTQLEAGKGPRFKTKMTIRVSYTTEPQRRKPSDD